MARLRPPNPDSQNPQAIYVQIWFDFLRLYFIGALELFRQWYFDIFFQHSDTSDPLQNFRNSNPVVILTGATSGIGYQLLLQLIRVGADVIAMTLCDHNVSVPKGCVSVPVDFNSRLSTEQAARKVELILSVCHARRKVVLFHCAGVYYPNQIGTRDGPADPVMQTLNINLLMPCLLMRILSHRISGMIWLGSSAQNAAPHLAYASSPLDLGTTPYSMYPLSKLLNVIHAERWGLHHDKPAVVIHPGIVATRLYQSEHGVIGILLRALMPYCAWSAKHSAQRVLHILQRVSFWERIRDGAHMAEKPRHSGIYFDAVSMAEAELPSQIQSQAGRACVAEKLSKLIGGFSQHPVGGGFHESSS